MWPFSSKQVERPRRSAREVAERCLCMEIVIERIDHENRVRAAGLEAWRAIAAELGIARHFTEDERRALATPVGRLADCDALLAHLYADVPYLLWALDRIPQLYSVDDLFDHLDVILRSGFRYAGDRGQIERALAKARLRPHGQIDNELSEIAHANAVLFGRPDTATTVPPSAVFHVWPWLQSSDWTWGEQVALEIELLGGRWNVSAAGLRSVGRR